MAFGVRGFPLGNPFAAARGGMNPAMLGAGPPNMDTGALNQLLGSYGVGLPQQLIAPGPFENMQGFAGGHPGLARGLDNALIAASLMGPTGMSAGENISNAARGILGVEPYRRQFAAEQYMLPLQVAQSVGGLQAQQAMMKMYEGMGKYYQETGEARLKAPEERFQQGLMKAQFDAAKTMRLGANGKVQQQVWDEKSMQPVWQDRPEIDPAEFKREQLRGKASSRFGGGAAGDYIANALAAHYGGYENIPEVIDPKVYRGVYGDVQRLSAGFQGKGVVPASDKYQDFMKAQSGVLAGMKYNIKNPDNAIKAELTRIAPGMMNSGADIAAVQKQAIANVQQRQRLDSQLDELYGQWAHSPELAGTQMPFDVYARQHGYDEQTRTFRASVPGGPTGSAPMPPAPGQPAQQFSPAMQQFMQMFQAPKPQ